MFVTNHVLAGSIAGSVFRDQPVAAFCTGVATHVLMDLSPHWGDATLSEDGRLVASGAVDGTVRVWETETGLPLADFHGQTDRIWGVALSGDARLVASSSVGGNVRIWETETGQSLTVVHGHTGMVSAIALSEDGQVVASSSFDGRPGTEKFSVVGRHSAGGALNTSVGNASCSACARRSRDMSRSRVRCRAARRT